LISKKVLLVDDVELFLELEKTFFRREGFDLLVARTGKQAFEMTLEHKPDLVFMDLFMPELNGDEACRKIKEHPETRRIPVVMVTQGGREDEIARCRAAGCDDIVLKPINRHHFLETARKYLGVIERMQPRVKAHLSIHFGPDLNRLMTDYAVNLSTGGLFIESENVLSVDSMLMLDFSLPDPARSICCKGRIAWVNTADDPINPKLPTGMGMQFLDLSLDDIGAIREYIKQQCLHPSW